MSSPAGGVAGQDDRLVPGGGGERSGARRALGTGDRGGLRERRGSFIEPAGRQMRTPLQQRWQRLLQAPPVHADADEQVVGGSGHISPCSTVEVVIRRHEIGVQDVQS